MPRLESRELMSLRHADILWFTRMGYSAAAIAKKCNISTRTVFRVRKAYREKN